jgi:hypothetical protein
MRFEMTDCVGSDRGHGLFISSQTIRSRTEDLATVEPPVDGNRRGVGKRPAERR